MQQHVQRCQRDETILSKLPIIPFLAKILFLKLLMGKLQEISYLYAYTKGSASAGLFALQEDTGLALEGVFFICSYYCDIMAWVR